MKAKIERMKTFLLKPSDTSKLVKLIEETSNKLNNVKKILRNSDFVSINLVSIATEAGFEECNRTMHFLKGQGFKVNNVIINDIGLTQVDNNSITTMAIGPYYEKDIDIITGYPNTTGVDCNISNLYYDPFKEEIKQFKPSNNLVNTIMEIRHKKCTLMLPRELIGIKNINQIILLQSRQHKYLLQGWKIQNIFNFPEPKLDWECAICYEKNAKNTNRKDIITLQCDHSYCKECLIEMSNSKECPTKDNCPLCRKLITTKIVDSSNEPINYNDYPRII